MTLAMRFDDKDWQRIKNDWMAWWNHDLDRPLVSITVSADDAQPVNAPHFTTNLPSDMPVEQVVALYGQAFEQQVFLGDAFPCWFPNFGPGIAAGFLGSTVQTAPDTVWFDPIDEKDLAAISLQHRTDSPWYQRILALCTHAASQWQNQICVAHTDLGGNLDILASLRGTEQLLMDVCDQPEQIERLVNQLTDVWLAYYAEFEKVLQQSHRGSSAWPQFWTPQKFYMLQCDFSYMISPDMFQRFVLPDLARCCGYLDYPFYHLDGPGEIPHLDHLLSLDHLRGIQWVPGAGVPSAEQWPELLQRIVDAGKLCQVYLTAQAALQLARQMDTKGFYICIIDIETESQARDFLHAFEQARV